MKKVTLVLLSLVFALLLSSCQMDKAIEKIKGQKNEGNKTDVAVDGINGENGNTEEGQSNDSDEDSDSKGKSNTSGTYAIYCNDTVSVVKDDLETKYTLVLFALSENGENGTYRGNIALNYGLDASQLTGINGAPITALGGFNVSLNASDVEFEVTKYDVDKYMTYGKEPSKDDLTLAPLHGGTSMALFTPTMTGTGEFGVEIEGEIDSNGGKIKGEVPKTSSGGSQPLLFKMYMEDGTVTIEIPSLAKAMDNQTFDAIITGNPDIIEQAEGISKDAFNTEEE